MFTLSMLFLILAIGSALAAFGVISVAWSATATILFYAFVALFIILFLVAMIQRPPKV